MSTLTKEHVPALERMLSDVQTDQAENLRWATITTATIAVITSHVQLAEQVDGVGAKVDQLAASVDKRFEQVDKRFEQVDKRFAEVDKRFDRLERKVDEGFANVDKRFGVLEDDMRFLKSHMERIAIFFTDFERPKGKDETA